MIQQGSIAVYARRAFSFSGRATRSEFWIATAIHWALLYLMGSIANLITPSSGLVSSIAESVFSLFLALILVSNVANGWRRMQDGGKMGWVYLQPILFTIIAYALFFGGVMAFLSSTEDAGGVAPGLLITGYVIYAAIGIATTISWIIALISLCKSSQPGPNKYGPNPHEVTQ